MVMVVMMMKVMMVMVGMMFITTHTINHKKNKNHNVHFYKTKNVKYRITCGIFDTYGCCMMGTVINTLEPECQFT